MFQMKSTKDKKLKFKKRLMTLKLLSDNIATKMTHKLQVLKKRFITIRAQIREIEDSQLFTLMVEPWMVTTRQIP